ncbi:MAG TPA: hypothetical protein DEB24_04050 [Coriobacteriia bacterium]|nr:hypothetical protein [Coriobacteriia bacterium]
MIAIKTTSLTTKNAVMTMPATAMAAAAVMVMITPITNMSTSTVIAMTVRITSSKSKRTVCT